MKLTKDFLKKKKACIEGTAWFHQSQCRTVEATLEKLDAEKKWSWAKWLMVRVLDRDDLARLAIYSAKLVLHIYEEKYPSDPRPRSAIDAAERYLLTKAPEDLKKCKVTNVACVMATNAAYAATDAATQATAYSTYAAYAAARAATAEAAEAAACADAATQATAYSAYAAACADAATQATAYSTYAAYAAARAREKIWTQIIQYVISLVKKYPKD